MKSADKPFYERKPKSDAKEILDRLVAGRAMIVYPTKISENSDFEGPQIAYAELPLVLMALKFFNKSHPDALVVERFDRGVLFSLARLIELLEPKNIEKTINSGCIKGNETLSELKDFYDRVLIRDSTRWGIETSSIPYFYPPRAFTLNQKNSDRKSSKERESILEAALEKYLTEVFNLPLTRRAACGLFFLEEGSTSVLPELEEREEHLVIITKNYDPPSTACVGSAFESSLMDLFQEKKRLAETKFFLVFKLEDVPKVLLENYDLTVVATSDATASIQLFELLLDPTKGASSSDTAVSGDPFFYGDSVTEKVASKLKKAALAHQKLKA